MCFRRIAVCVAAFMLLLNASAQAVYVQLSEDFNLQKFELLPDGKIIACGCIGTPIEHRAAMLKIAADGSCTEVTPAADTHEGHYRDIVTLDSDSIIALRSVPNADTWRVGRIDSGEITWMTAETENVFSLDCMGENILVYCKPETATAEIRCLNTNGQQLWKIRFEERIVLHGILVGEERNFAYGYKLEDPRGDGSSQRSTFLMFEFDHQGKILWRKDGASYDNSEISRAVWASDGVVVIENGRLMKYADGEPVWTCEFEGNTIEDVLAVDGGYLVADGLSHWGQVYKLSEDGTLVGEYSIDDCPGGYFDLFESGGTAWMLISNHFGPMYLVRIPT